LIRSLPLGFAILFLRGILLRATLMKGLLKMLSQVISLDMPNATSSPESESGPTLSDKQDGPTTDQSGPEAARANLSARQAKDAGLLTSGTYGRFYSISYASADLQRSLENRLRAKTDLLGSTLFKLTWKDRNTPSGRRICALRASALRTSAKDSTSWPTTTTRDWKGPQGRAYKNPGKNLDLPAAVTLTSWPTTTTRDWKDGSECPNVPLNSLLGRVAWLTDSGPMPSGYTAAIKSSGQLNPALPRWLQGLPTAWESCADMVTPLRRKLRKASSKPTLKVQKTDKPGDYLSDL
jgi:hypothetical protein